MLNQMFADTSVRKLDCKIHSRIDSVSKEDFTRLFPSLPDSNEMIQFVQNSGFDDFTFYNIVVYHEGKPILFLPLFETQYNLSTFLEGWTRKAIGTISRWTGRLLRPRVLAVGFVEGEWGEIGFDRETDQGTLSFAWDLALKNLQMLASKLDADILAFANFNDRGGSSIPVDKLGGFEQITSIPCAQLPVRGNMEDYLSRLSKNMRKDLRRKMRKADQIKIVRTCDPSSWIDTIYRFYIAQIEQSALVFGVYHKGFFAHVCEQVPDTEYVLYFLDERLIAFNLVVNEPNCLVDKYFGMDFELGRKYGLYFVSWLENIRYCAERHIPLYHAGQTCEKTKSRLDATLLSSLILFKHRNPLIHWLLSAFREQLSYHPEVDLPEVRLGSAWDKSYVFPKEVQINTAFSW